MRQRWEAFATAGLAWLVTVAWPAVAAANPMYPGGRHPLRFLGALMMVGIPLLIECLLLLWLLRGHRLPRAHLFGLLAVMNFATWTWLIPDPNARDRGRQSLTDVIGPLAAAEVAIVVVEAVGIYYMARYLATQAANARPVGLGKAFALSLAANLVSLLLPSSLYLL